MELIETSLPTIDEIVGHVEHAEALHKASQPLPHRGSSLWQGAVNTKSNSRTAHFADMTQVDRILAEIDGEIGASERREQPASWLMVDQLPSRRSLADEEDEAIEEEDHLQSAVESAAEEIYVLGLKVDNLGLLVTQQKEEIAELRRIIMERLPPPPPPPPPNSNSQFTYC